MTLPIPLRTSSWRREPFRVFFPLGFLLVWAGVLPWLLYAIEPGWGYRSIYHAMTQIQAFLMCFAIGFLFTMVPRRTGTPAPAVWEMTAALALPVVSVACAWQSRWELAQGAWILLVLVLLAFLVRRIRMAPPATRPPASFIWIPVSLLLGVGGAALTGLGGWLAPRAWWLHLLGSRLVLQGMFTGLVLGVGGFLIPLVTRSVPPPPGARRARAGHALAALVLAASFAFDALALRRPELERFGPATRGLVALAVLVVSARLTKGVTVPGWNALVIWFAAWMVPAGFLATAIFPELGKGGLHLTFVTGFALLAFSVANHVAASHSGRHDLVSRRIWQAPALVLLLVGSAVCRVLVEVDGERFATWLAAAASSFLVGTLVWASFAMPLLLRTPARWEEASRC